MPSYRDISNCFVAWEEGSFFLGRVGGWRVRLDYPVEKIEYKCNYIYVCGGNSLQKYNDNGTLIWTREVKGALCLTVREGHVTVVGQGLWRFDLAGRLVWERSHCGTWISGEYIVRDNEVYRVNELGEIIEQIPLNGVSHVLSRKRLYVAGTENGMIYAGKMKNGFIWIERAKALNVGDLDYNNGLIVVGELNGKGSFGDCDVKGKLYAAKVNRKGWKRVTVK